MHTFNVCDVINSIYETTKDKTRERIHLAQKCTSLEQLRDKMIDEYHSLLGQMHLNLEKLIDQKIQLDLDLC